MRSRQAASGGFTLIEILLVVFIILIGTAITLPSFVRAYRGARLNTAARNVVTMHRLARGSAVLRQQSFALYIYKDLGKLELVSLSPESGVSARDPEAMDPSGGFSDEGGMVASFSVNVEAERMFPRDVTVFDVELEMEDQSEGEISWINYYPNGMCDPYTVILADENGRQAKVLVDPLSGRVEVKYD